MVTGVSLTYDPGFLGGNERTCSDISTSGAQATVQDIMNLACLSLATCTDSGFICYTSKYFEGMGNFLEHVVFSKSDVLPKADYNASQGYWHLGINGESASKGMGLQPINSNDHIRWTFTKIDS